MPDVNINKCHACHSRAQLSLNGTTYCAACARRVLYTASDAHPTFHLEGTAPSIRARLRAKAIAKIRAALKVAMPNKDKDFYDFKATCVVDTLLPRAYCMQNYALFTGALKLGIDACEACDLVVAIRSEHLLRVQWVASMISESYSACADQLTNYMLGMSNLELAS